MNRKCYLSIIFIFVYIPAVRRQDSFANSHSMASSKDVNALTR